MGDDEIHQSTEILRILGTPPREIILKFGTSAAWDLFSPPNPQFKPVPWAEVYPFASEAAHNLMDKLLCWDSSHRYNVTALITHDFLSSVRDFNDEPTAPDAFDFDFEATATSLNDYKILIHDEVEEFKINRLGNFKR